MKIVVLGGYGEIGRVISADLSATFEGKTVIAGRDIGKAKLLARSFNSKSVTGAYADISDAHSMDVLLEDADVLINATNYYTNIEAMGHALRNSVHYLDLGGLYHVTLRQLKLHRLFRNKGILALLGCGSTPGITNIMANHASGLFDSIHSIHIQFGDKDHTNYNMPIVVPYSMYTVMDEFSKRPALFTKGRIRFVDPLSGALDVNFPKPVGRVNCFYTLHSELASIPKRFAYKGLKECSFRGGFDREFVSRIKFLIDAGFASSEMLEFNGIKIRPLDVTVKILDRFLPPASVKVNDVEILRVALNGKSKGRARSVVMYCTASADRKWNISAGSWDTGVPASIIAQMITKEKINARGVLPSDDDCIDSHAFFRELAKRKIRVFMDAR